MYESSLYCQQCGVEKAITIEQYKNTMYNDDIFRPLCPDCQINLKVSKGTDKQKN